MVPKRRLRVTGRIVRHRRLQLLEAAVRGPRNDGVILRRAHLAKSLLITCKYAKSQLCEVFVHASAAQFHVKKNHTKPSAAAFSLGCRDNSMNNCFYNFGSSTEIPIFGLPELNNFWITLSGDGFSVFSHPFTSAGSEKLPNASAGVARLTRSCKELCWETQWPESPSLPPVLAVSTLISPSASPGRHLLLFFQMASCRGDKARRLPLKTT